MERRAGWVHGKEGRVGTCKGEPWRGRTGQVFRRQGKYTEGRAGQNRNVERRAGQRYRGQGSPGLNKPSALRACWTLTALLRYVMNPVWGHSTDAALDHSLKVSCALQLAQFCMSHHLCSPYHLSACLPMQLLLSTIKRSNFWHPLYKIITLSAAACS